MADMSKVPEYDAIQNRIKGYADAAKIAIELENQITGMQESSAKKLHDLKLKYATQEAKKAEQRLKKQKDWDTKSLEEKTKAIEEEVKKREAAINKLAEEEDKRDEKRLKQLNEKINKSSFGALIGSFTKAINANGFRGFVAGMGDLATQLNDQIDAIAGLKSTVDTRLQGSARGTNWMGSYWDRINKNMTSLSTRAFGLVSQEQLSNNVVGMIKSGISFNVEQRAFLNTIKDKIADTFDANNGTLLRLVRIQQQDSTAARLGMESSMTAFLNNMYSNTEYMSSVMQEVKNSLQEAEALMTTKGAVEFEYQVQKWMGSLYSVGFGNSSSIVGALNQLASGDISGLTSSGVGNLMITAANRAGMSISDILNNGLGASETNELMSAMVGYLQQIARDTNGSKLLQQQYANIYGLKASDLRAVMNLADSMSDISKNNLTYSGAEGQLVSMLSSAYSRTSLGELSKNAFGNMMYSMSSGIANSPVLYGIYKAANLLDAVADGGDFSLPIVWGTGTAQTFNIAQLMKMGALGGGILSNMGALFGAGSDIKAFSDWGSILGLGSNMTTVSRGNGRVGGTVQSGFSTSNSTYVGNANGGDVYDKTVTDVTNEESQKVSAAKDSDEKTLSDVDTSVLKIYELLENVISGAATFHVAYSGIDDYGYSRQSGES